MTIASHQKVSVQMQVEVRQSCKLLLTSHNLMHVYRGGYIHTTCVHFPHDTVWLLQTFDLPFQSRWGRLSCRIHLFVWYRFQLYRHIKATTRCPPPLLIDQNVPRVEGRNKQHQLSIIRSPSTHLNAALLIITRSFIIQYHHLITSDIIVTPKIFALTHQIFHFYCSFLPLMLLWSSTTCSSCST